MLTYSEQYKIRTSDLDYRDDMRLSAYLDLFQTIAGKHADLLGLGYEQMLKKGIAWVITKVKFDCLLPLKSDETVTVVTEPHEKGLMDFTRDYYVYNECFEGEFTTRSAYPKRHIERVAAVGEAPTYVHEIVRTDLDHNGHTNNIRYADMIFNAVELPGLPKRVIVNYHSESKLGDKVEIAYCRDGGEYVFTGRKNGETCFTAKLFYGEIID